MSKEGNNKKIILEKNYKKFSNVRLKNLVYKSYKNNKYLYLVIQTLYKELKKVEYKIIKACIND